MELEKLEDAYLTFEIDLALKIESPDGLILFTGQSDKIDADYISFGLQGGYPIFRCVIFLLIYIEKKICFSSEIRGLCLMKSPSERIQNLLYF